jgi:hypothetical protein
MCAGCGLLLLWWCLPSDGQRARSPPADRPGEDSVLLCDWRPGRGTRRIPSKRRGSLLGSVRGLASFGRRWKVVVVVLVMGRPCLLLRRSLHDKATPGQEAWGRRSRLVWWISWLVQRRASRRESKERLAVGQRVEGMKLEREWE